MADISGWITIKQMVQEILYETDRDEGFYKKCMHHVINGVREINQFHYDNIKTVKVTCDSNGIIDMPTDYVQFVRLSMNYGGLMYPLVCQDKMVRTFTEEDGDETIDSDIGEDKNLDTGGDYVYSTTGAKHDYYYTIDEREHRIVVGNLPTRTLFLQYISSGIDLTDGNGATIPLKIKQALKWYVLYKDALASDFGNKQAYGLYKQEYEEELNKLHMLNLPTADELLDILYETYRPLRR